MKSAFDLAMEKFGGPVKQLSEEKKAKIAEVESRFKAKIAEAEMAKDKRFAEASGDVMKTEDILKDFSVEIASINFQCEREKEKIRDE